MSTLLRSLSVPGYGQLQVSEQRRMPVDDGTTANIQTVTGETVQFFYYDTSTGVLTQDAGQAAGVVVVANLTNKNLLNNLGDVIGSYGDSSFAFTTGTILTTLRPFRGLLAEQTEQNGLSILKAGQLRANSVTDGFKNGEYCIDHERGVIYGKKATTGTSDVGTYKILASGGAGTITGTSVTVSTLSNVSDSATSVTLLSANSSRLGATFFNDSTVAAYIKEGTTASLSSFSYKLSAGATLEAPLPIYKGRYDCIWDSDQAGAMRITERT